MSTRDQASRAVGAAAGRPSGASREVARPDRVDVLVQRLDSGLPVPSYAHPGDAGADLCTAVDVELPPGERALVPTGIAIALPDGYAAFVHPRSGLGHRLGVSIVNTPGTVDAGYRGEITVILVNHDLREPAVFKRGDRIAQLVIQRVERAAFHEVTTLPGSARGTGGYGSTGGFSAPAVEPAARMT
jgi:dUTP pyrophosphatase